MQVGNIDATHGFREEDIDNTRRGSCGQRVRHINDIRQRKRLVQHPGCRSISPKFDIRLIDNPRIRRDQRDAVGAFDISQADGTQVDHKHKRKPCDWCGWYHCARCNRDHTEASSKISFEPEIRDADLADIDPVRKCDSDVARRSSPWRINENRRRRSDVIDCPTIQNLQPIGQRIASYIKYLRPLSLHTELIITRGTRNQIQVQSVLRCGNRIDRQRG